jgi:hypothetical protein
MVETLEAGMSFLHSVWNFIWNYSAPFLAIGGGLWAFLSALWAKRIEAKTKDRLDKEFARYKAALDIFSFENQTKFAQLHSERATIIKQFHAKLLGIERALENLTDDLGADPSLSSFHRKVYLAIKNCEEFGREHRMFFQTDLLDRLHVLFAQLYKTADKIKIAYNNGAYDEKAVDEWLDSDNELARLLLELENEFRKLLGVTCPPSIKGDDR